MMPHKNFQYYLLYPIVRIFSLCHYHRLPKLHMLKQHKQLLLTSFATFSSLRGTFRPSSGMSSKATVIDES